MLPEFKRILYCTDMSDSSVNACRYALYLARETGAEIYVLYVAEKPSTDAMLTLETYVKDFGNRKDFVAKRVSQAEEMLTGRLNGYLESLPNDEKPPAGKMKILKVCEAHPVDEILSQSKRLQCDLILMGTHRKGVAHTFLGSVSKRVMSNTRIPVLVVPLPAL